MKRIAMLVIIPPLLLLSSCSKFIVWQTKNPDNPAEEFIEDLIKYQTDRDIDLTPFTGPERQSFDK